MTGSQPKPTLACGTLLVLLVVMGIGMPLPAAAQGDTISSSGPCPLDTIWSDTKALVVDAALIYTSPLRFDMQGWGVAGGVIGGTALAMVIDDPVRTVAQQGHDALRDEAADVGNYYGERLTGLVVSGSIYLTGLIADDPGIRLAGRHVAQALTYAGLLTATLKYTLGRHRPLIAPDPQTYTHFSRDDALQSLPSGHTTVAFAISSSLAADIDNPWATVGLYGLATLTAASRIYRDRHWLSDTFLAAAIGTACGYGVVHLHDPDDDDQASLLVIPAPDGITAVWRF